MIEIWKDIAETNGIYQVSNLGKVRRIGDYSNQTSSWLLSEPKILTPRLHSNGYLRVMFSINGKHSDRYMHRLVVSAFCDNQKPQKYKEVNHIDGNKVNNCYSNLEWCDRSYNNKHAYIKGLHSVHGCYGNKKKVAQIDINTNIILSIFDSVEAASKNVSLKNFTNISACCNYAENPNKYKRPCLSAKGYKWRFTTDNMKVGDYCD